jgi:hypothetical protein
MDIKKQIKIENTLINSMISDKEPWDPKAVGQELYSKQPFEKKLDLDREAFKYFVEKYEAKKIDNPKFNDITFENFLKLERPEDEFMEELRDPNKYRDATISKVWRDMYGGDTGLLKISALEGKKRTIINING